jgi:hypothetical protein
MNIFYLSRNIKRCAKYHVDRHCVKMILEYCQLLCTAIWLSGGTAHCKATHENHPCAIWTRANKSNWLWLQKLALALCEEYTYRYNKTHSMEPILKELEVPPIPEGEFFQPPQAMPAEYKNPDSITAYRTYYMMEKTHLFFWKDGRPAWKGRNIPRFVCEFS